MKLLLDPNKILDDFQHQVENKISRLKDIPGFPERKSDLSEEDLSDYLFYYQAALDSKGSELTQYTVAGILIVIPILVLSAIPDQYLPFGNVLDIICAVASGLVLYLIYRALSSAMVRNKIRKVNEEYPSAKAYVDEVIRFKG